MAKEKKKRTSFGEYFKGVKTEMKKVVWPTKKEMVSYTAVVIMTCAIFALGFWLIDTGVLVALREILGVTLQPAENLIQVIGLLQNMLKREGTKNV